MTVEGDGVFSALREHRIARRHVFKYGFASGMALSAAPSLGAVASAAAASAPSSRQSIVMRPQAETPRFDGLTLKMSTGDTYLEIFKMYADEVKEKFGVEFAYTMPAAQEMYQKDMLEFASGASTHDVVLFQPAWLPDYALTSPTSARSARNTGWTSTWTTHSTSSDPVTPPGRGRFWPCRSTRISTTSITTASPSRTSGTVRLTRPSMRN